MIKGLLQSQKDVERMLKDEGLQTNWLQETDWFNKQIQHLQHERLIHLLVTLTVGVAGLISCFYSFVNPIVPIFILLIAIGIPILKISLDYLKVSPTTNSGFKWWRECIETRLTYLNIKKSRPLFRAGFIKTKLTIVYLVKIIFLTEEKLVPSTAVASIL